MLDGGQKTITKLSATAAHIIQRQATIAEENDNDSNLHVNFISRSLDMLDLENVKDEKGEQMVGAAGSGRGGLLSIARHGIQAPRFQAQACLVSTPNSLPLIFSPPNLRFVAPGERASSHGRFPVPQLCGECSQMAWGSMLRISPAQSLGIKDAREWRRTNVETHQVLVSGLSISPTTSSIQEHPCECF